MDKTKFTTSPENFGEFKIKTEGRRMKLYIKLNKEETEMWGSMKEAFTQGNVPDDQLARIFLFKGIDAINRELDERIANLTEEEKAEIVAKIEAENSEPETKVGQGDGTLDPETISNVDQN